MRSSSGELWRPAPLQTGLEAFWAMRQETSGMALAAPPSGRKRPGSGGAPSTQPLGVREETLGAWTPGLG